MRLGDRNCKDDLDPLKKLQVIAAGVQRRSLHYWGAHNITEGFLFFLVLLCSSSSSRGLSLLSSCNTAGFLLVCKLMDNGESHKGFFF